MCEITCGGSIVLLPPSGELDLALGFCPLCPERLHLMLMDSALPSSRLRGSWPHAPSLSPFHLEFLGGSDFGLIDGLGTFSVVI